MNINEYQEFAMKTYNKELNKNAHLVNATMGLCGEAGEATNIVKKYLSQGHKLDKENLISELGDIAWYLAEMATVLDISLEDIFIFNINKLKERYPNGFEAEKSINRINDVF